MANSHVILCNYCIKISDIKEGRKKPIINKYYEELD